MKRSNKVSGMEEKETEFQTCRSGELEKEAIIEQLRANGFQITRQRKLLIDIILEEPCTCCKEVYYLAVKKDPGIGNATVYRTVDALEQIGALKRKTAYQLCGRKQDACRKCLIRMEDDTTVELDHQLMGMVIEKGLKQCGFSKGKRVKGVTLVKSEEE